MEFAKKLRRLLDRDRLSQERLAELVGTSQNQVSRWCRGVSVPDLRAGLAIARTFGVTLDYLADDAQDEPPDPEIRPEERAFLVAVRKLGVEVAMDRLLERGGPYRGVAVRDLDPPSADQMEGQNPGPESVDAPKRVR